MMRSRRRAVIACAATAPPFLILDLMEAGPHAFWLCLVRLVWGVVLLVAGLGLPTASASSRRRLLTLIMFTCGVCMSAIAALNGGYNNPYFAWLIALPFCFVALAQDEVGATLVGSATTFAGAVTILHLASPGAALIAQWSLCVGTACGLAVYASVSRRAQLRDEYVQIQERLKALQQLKESEKFRAQAERMALVGQLAAGVAHEINNPLGFVISNLEFLKGDLGAPSTSADERGEVMRETLLGLKRIQGIVGDLTAFSREGVEETTEVDLNEVVAEAERLASVRTKGRVGVVNELPPNLDRVIGNRRHLGQVFLNLFLNAADAFASGRSDGRIWIRAVTVGDGLRVDVEDNGPGFAEGVRSSLFQPFFTTKGPGKGTGLGLATSREYLRRAGGDLLASERTEGGARFTLALCRVRADP